MKKEELLNQINAVTAHLEELRNICQDVLNDEKTEYGVGQPTLQIFLETSAFLAKLSPLAQVIESE